MFSKKLDLNSILASYRTQLGQLKTLVANNKSEIKNKQTIIIELQKEVAILSTENKKAANIRDNISKMLEENDKGEV